MNFTAECKLISALERIADALEAANVMARARNDHADALYQQRLADYAAERDAQNELVKRQTAAMEEAVRTQQLHLMQHAPVTTVA